MIDLPKKELDELGISTISCYVNMAGKSYSDLDDITPEDVFTHFEKTKEIAKTAAKSPEIYAEFFRPFVAAGDTVIHFAVSSGISSIYVNAKAAGERVGNVFVIDTLTLSGGIALLVKFALSLIESGETDAKKIYELCLEKRKNVQVSFLIETLDCLYKGGRCNGLQYFSANLLKLKPVIYMNETGHMKTREKCRGSHRRAIAQFIENTFKKYPDPDLKQLYVSHFCYDKELRDYVLETIARYKKFENIQLNDIGCNCAIHSGRNSFGICFLVK